MPSRGVSGMHGATCGSMGMYRAWGTHALLPLFFGGGKGGGDPCNHGSVGVWGRMDLQGINPKPLNT